MENCLFCRIINKEIPSYILYEDDYVVSFLDVFPTSTGHCLILPKKHYKNLLECDDKTMNAIFKAIKIIGQALLKTYGLGLNILSNINEVAGQSIMHAHIHLIPVNKDGAKAIVSFKTINNVDLETIKKTIIENL